MTVGCPTGPCKVGYADLIIPQSLAIVMTWGITITEHVTTDTKSWDWHGNLGNRHQGRQTYRVEQWPWLASDPNADTEDNGTPDLSVSCGQYSSGASPDTTLDRVSVVIESNLLSPSIRDTTLTRNWPIGPISWQQHTVHADITSSEDDGQQLESDSYSSTTESDSEENWYDDIDLPDLGINDEDRRGTGRVQSGITSWQAPQGS